MVCNSLMVNFGLNVNGVGMVVLIGNLYLGGS